ncbi:MAG: uroporphyrinogen decarboxylase family protein [Fusobacteriaceae bacterium]
MTPLERVKNHLEGKGTDKIPNLNIVMAFAAKEIGVTYKEFATDYRKLVEANIVCCEKYGIDMVSCISDPVREAHDLGAKIIFPENSVPYEEEHIIKSIEDVKQLNIVNPYIGKRMSDRLNAIKLYKEKVGGYYPILGWAEGAFAEAADLRGLGDFMMDLMTDEDFCIKLLEKTYEQKLAFVKAQIETGADFVGIGDAAASLIGPELYEKFVFPYEKRICDEIHKMGAKMKLHICGNITSLLPLIKEIKPDIVDLDWQIDMSYAVDVFKGAGIAISGNLNPVADIERKTAEDLSIAIRECYKKIDRRGCISGGCEIPAATPEENMLAMNDEIKKLSAS